MTAAALTVNKEWNAVRNVTVTKRNTLLKERLAGQIQAKRPAMVYYPDCGERAGEAQMVAEEKEPYGKQ